MESLLTADFNIFWKVFTMTASVLGSYFLIRERILRTESRMDAQEERLKSVHERLQKGEETFKELKRVIQENSLALERLRGVFEFYLESRSKNKEF